MLRATEKIVCCQISGEKNCEPGSHIYFVKIIISFLLQQIQAYTKAEHALGLILCVDYFLFCLNLLVIKIVTTLRVERNWPTV